MCGTSLSRGDINNRYDQLATSSAAMYEWAL